MASAGSKPSIQIIPNLIQGVSQQAPQSRRDAQAEEQMDCINSVLEGVVPRPHGDFMKLWAGADWNGSLFSETSHGDDENYLVGVKADGTPFAFNLADGTDCVVTSTAPDYSYLSAGAAPSRDKLRAQVVDDTTFICNRQVTPAMAGTTSPAIKHEAIVFIRATAYSSTYEVILSGPGAATGTSTTDDDTVDPTTQIAIEIAAGIDGVSGYTCDIYGSVLHIYRADGAAFSISTSDGNGDDYMRAFNGQAASYDKLPAKAPSGIIIKVNGEDNQGADDYYVKFVGDPSTGVWQETVAPGTPTSIDAASMPHVMVCTGVNTFEFRRPSFSTRIAGDTDTAKDPSFIGKPIRDMIYHQRRLAMIWAGGSVFSKTAFPYTYFPDTVQTLLATAPVDFTVSSGDKRGASTLDFGLQAQESLFLWAQKSQFRVSSGQDPFKQDTVEVIPSMSYQYASNAYPLPVASFVFLATDVGDYASLRALTFSQTKVAGDIDVTSHVGQYIASGVSGLTSSDTLRTIFVQTLGNTSVLYLFNYTYDADQGFIQSAINTWRIPGGEILWAGFKDNYLRVIQQRPEGVVFLRFNLTPQVKDPIAGAGYCTRLDFRVSEAGVSSLTYDAVTNTTSFVVPYIPTGPDIVVATSADKTDGYTRGRIFPVLSVSTSTVVVKGNLTGYQFYVGQRITSYRTESTFFVRTDKGSLPLDRLTLNRFFLTLAQTCYTRVEINTPSNGTKSYEFTGQQLGGGAHTGTPTPSNGMITAPVAAASEDATITLINDTFLPSYWQSAAYDYTPVGWSGLA
ncbi:hypothetical protein ACQZ6C_10755 [Rhizobium rhizogenes]